MWGVVIALAVAARFVLETSLVNRLPAALAVAAAVIPATLAIVAMSLGVKPRAPLQAKDLELATVAGVLGVWLAPFLVAAMRRTDAPSGTEVLFFTTASWGALLVLGGFFAGKARTSTMRVAGAVAGMTGAAGLLANWERPSSFNPFVKFPVQELVMLLAGVAFVVSIRLLEGLVRKHGALTAARAVALPGAVAAFIGALAFAPGRLSSLLEPNVWAFALPAAAAAFALLLGWVQALDRQPFERLASLYFLAPALVTALYLVEQATGVFGPDPIRWGAALPGIAVGVTGAVLVALAPVDSAERPSRLTLAARVLAVISLALAVAALVAPAVEVSVRGVLTTGPGFQTRFVMQGWETAGGWLALCCSTIVAAWAWRSPRTWRTAILATAALLLVSAAWFPLHETTLHTWTRWIPAAVQQDYGTEYSSRKEQPVETPWQAAALVSAALPAAILLFDRRESAETALEGQEVPKA